MGMCISTRDFPTGVVSWSTAINAAAKHKPWRDDLSPNAWRPLTKARKRHLACKINTDESVDFRLYNTVCVTYHKDGRIDLDLSYEAVSTNAFINHLTPSGVIVCSQLAGGTLLLNDGRKTQRSFMRWRGDCFTAYKPRGGIATIRPIGETTRVVAEYNGQTSTETDTIFELVDSPCTTFEVYTFNRKETKRARESVPNYQEFIDVMVATLTMAKPRISWATKMLGQEYAGTQKVLSMIEEKAYLPAIAHLALQCSWREKINDSHITVGKIKAELCKLIYSAKRYEYDLVTVVEHETLPGYSAVKSAVSTRTKLGRYS